MRVAGVDLAGVQRNESGYCILDDSGGHKLVSTRLLHTDDEILSALKSDSPIDLVAVDAPMSYDGSRRKCDDLLREYGALPVTLRGMETLAKRGKSFADTLSAEGCSYIEVFSTGSAKILGVYNKDNFMMQKAMMGLDLQGDVNTRILSRDELDALAAAVTAYLHMHSRTRVVGDMGGQIIVPLI